ncbi:type I site-specific deoxyribonuclease chain R [Tolypothrix sp. NIES-4075]|uniref:type I restriction endonuclease n=1 Tax=Tolypothrix sp. NIES-4075 TaxID=2005459 RepID=UPI000B5C7777|nr:type I restriction endonuclease [Tolypothrix sp. NIES-4075]GAX45170.1 type I site-specific deoxyribonuclease chain R [Tolypothrix sp. NIES-4075]
MNQTQPTRATVTSSIPRKLRRRFDFKQSVAAPSLLTWFEVIGYTVLLEQDIASLKYRIGRTSYTEVILRDRLYSALKRINPTLPDEAISAAISQITITDCNLLENNRSFHKFLTDGIEVEYLFNEQIVSDKVWLIDSDNLLNNDWLVIHPFTVVEGSHAHCPDVVVFINGLPLAVIVSIHASDEQATFKAGYERLQTYIQQIPKLFYYNTLVAITCGNRARVGTLTSDLQEFLPWRTIDGEDFPDSEATELEVLIQGVFDKRRFLHLLQHFIVFEDTEVGINKKILCRPFCTIPTKPYIQD